MSTIVYVGPLYSEIFNREVVIKHLQEAIEKVESNTTGVVLFSLAGTISIKIDFNENEICVIA